MCSYGLPNNFKTENIFADGLPKPYVGEAPPKISAIKISLKSSLDWFLRIDDRIMCMFDQFNCE